MLRGSHSDLGSTPEVESRTYNYTDPMTLLKALLIGHSQNTGYYMALICSYIYIKEPFKGTPCFPGRQALHPPGRGEPAEAPVLGPAAAPRRLGSPGASNGCTGVPLKGSFKRGI